MIVTVSERFLTQSLSEFSTEFHKVKRGFCIGGAKH